MANHVTTRCIVTGDEREVRRFKELMICPYKDSITNEWGLCFDFNKIIPMPPHLLDSEESMYAQECVSWFILRSERHAPYYNGGLFESDVKKVRIELGMQENPIYDVAEAYLKKYPEKEQVALKRLKAILETGYGSWYPWSIKKWGTKWNSYEFELASEEPLEFKFDTAWSFPVPIFEALTKEFPLLQFECICFDEGWNFAGEGYFNPVGDNKEFSICKATPELYERVYGEKYVPDEEDEEDEEGSE